MLPIIDQLSNEPLERKLAYQMVAVLITLDIPQSTYARTIPAGPGLKVLQTLPGDAKY